MDNQRQQYIPAPPPPPPTRDNNLSHVLPPPPRPYPQSNIPPPPPGPHPSSLPPGTVYGLPGGWQQSWGRPSMGQPLPPPPPMTSYGNSQNQHTAYGSPARQPSHLNIPPPPPQYDKPILSATFIPGGDSFGPGVGIPPLEDYSSYSSYNRYDNNVTSESSRSSSDPMYSDGLYNSHTYNYAATTQPVHEIANRESRAASASANRPPFNLQKREISEPVSPGPPTAILASSQTGSDQHIPVVAGRQRAHSALVMGASGDTASQWPIDRVVIWLAANGFSKDWQDTFKDLKLEGADFLELGRGANGRVNLGKMHSTIYPHLARVCSSNNTGWDQSREREEGRRLRRLILRLAEAETPSSAGTGHRRRESGAIPSASTDGTLEGSPNLSRPDFSTPTTAGTEGSPGKQMPAQLNIGGVHARNSQSRSSTLPVFSKHSSSNSTPSDGRHPDSLHGPNRSDYSKNILAGVGSRVGRHSPSLSGDAPTSLAPKSFDVSPSSSPGLGYALPSSATSASNHTQRPDHAKSNSTDSMLKATGYSRSALNVPGLHDSARNGQIKDITADLSGPGRFYENQNQNQNQSQNRRDGTELFRISPSERTFSNEYAPGPGGKDQSKRFLAKFMRKKHDQNLPTPEDHPLESPTSPGNFKSFFPFAKPAANGSDSALVQRPASGAIGFDEDKNAVRARRGTRSSRRYVFVTPDYWSYRLVDITEAESAAALRNIICLEFDIANTDSVQLFATEPGQTNHDEELTDSNLLSTTSRADNLGTVKLYIQTLATSAVSAPAAHSSGLGMLLSQRLQNNQISTGQPMVKSASTGGPNRDSYPVSIMSPSSQLMSPNVESVQTDSQTKSNFEARQTPKEPPAISTTGIRSRGVIDFDSPRASPYRDEKTDSLVPVRKPPAAPSESSTLTKVNSLRARTSTANRNSLEAMKRISDPIAEENAGRGKKKQDQGIGAALANMGRMAGTPATLAQERPRSGEFGQKGSSPSRPARTGSGMNKGNSMFKTPTYDDGTATSKPSHVAIENLRRFNHSPAVSPSTEQTPRPQFHTQKSYGPDLEFQETNVSFAPSPHPVQHDSDDEDDDSDDGLFAIPLAKASATKTPSAHEATTKDQRPNLTVDTDQLGRKPKVTFHTPNSSGGVSIKRSSTDDSANTSGDGFDRSFSDGSFSGSAQSPDERMNRRDSFVSDIWANRPAVENVVENLDEFFPGVDLDKPFMEERNDGNSPMKSAGPPGLDNVSESLGPRVTFSSTGFPPGFSHDKEESDTLGSDQSTLKAKDRPTITGLAQRQMEKSGGLSRMKSIREVAQRRNDISRGPSVSARVEPTNASGIIRRKSTKMFGANIVQIKPRPGSRLSTLDPIPQEEVPTDDTPKRQATFKIIRGQLIGKGTYGRVYLGMNATTGEFLAVKQVEVNPKTAGQEKDRIKEMVAALDIEIDTMKDLEHPNIVQYLGCERKELSISIYLEYISGGSVGSCLRKHGKFEESVVRSLTRQTLEGLAYLHREGILHRDLKADNILLDLDGTCKISDFGISKRSNNIYGNDVTYSMQGSVFWMAPEVVRSQGVGYSAKVDIWSLGCVVLEMFAGKRPWSKEEAIGAIFKLGNLNQAPPIPEDVSATASVDGLNFMYDCFQINTQDRPTAEILLRHSTFCIKDPSYQFFDTQLAAKLRIAEIAPL